jgi:glycosyltransferase involved in cell wall biosynthesis
VAFLRILQIAHCYYSPFLDCSRQYAKLFEGTGYKVVTVYLTGAPNDEVAKATCSDEVIFLNYRSDQVRGLKLAAIHQIRKLVANESFLFCIAHRSKPTYIALMATNLPVVSVHHNHGDFDRFSRRVLVNIFKRRLLLLGVSNSVRDEMRDLFPKWPANQIETLYNRIDVEFTKAGFESKEFARDFLGIPQESWVIGNVARLHHVKDQKTLLRGFKIALPGLPVGAVLVIMGSGPLESELKELAKNLAIEDQVIFTGNIPNGRRFFKAFDIFAFTSAREAFGMVLLEAMAADLPVVCSDSTGGAEVVEGVADFFELGNPCDLARVLISVSSHEFDATAMMARLNRYFSYDAARASFFNLPFIKEKILESKLM